MQNVKGEVLEYIKRHRGPTEREIARALYGPRGRQQQINPTCRLLVEEGVVERRGYGGPGDPFQYFLRSSYRDRAAPMAAPSPDC